MEKLPPVEEQEWLLDCLRMLLQRRGAGPFLERTLLTVEALGPWSPGSEGVARYGRRILDHVGLHDLELRVTAVPAGLGPTALYHPGTPLYLASFSSGLVIIALASDARADRRTVAGLLAHELSHVWRSHNDLEVVEPDTEERLTDLSSNYLGLGILTLNLAVRAREQRAAEIGVAPISAGAIGGLGVESLAFLLAGQVLARREGCLATCGVARRLEPDARRSFAEALRAVRRLEGGLPWRLRLPGHSVPAFPELARSERASTLEPTRVRDDLDGGAR